MRVVAVAGTENIGIAQNRYSGYKNALKKYNIEYHGELVHHISMNSEKEGYLAAQQLLDLPSPPDAIFVSNDIGAIGAMKAIKERGLRIPEDIAVVGFSDWQISSMVE